MRCMEKMSTCAYLKHVCTNIHIKNPGEEEERRARELGERQPRQAGLVRAVGSMPGAAPCPLIHSIHAQLAGVAEVQRFCSLKHVFDLGLPEFLTGGNFTDGRSRTELLLSNSSPLQRW